MSYEWTERTSPFYSYDPQRGWRSFSGLLSTPNLFMRWERRRGRVAAPAHASPAHQMVTLTENGCAAANSSRGGPSWKIRTLLSGQSKLCLQPLTTLLTDVTGWLRGTTRGGFSVATLSHRRARTPARLCIHPCGLPGPERWQIVSGPFSPIWAILVQNNSVTPLKRKEEG